MIIMQHAWDDAAQMYTIGNRNGTKYFISWFHKQAKDTDIIQLYVTTTASSALSSTSILWPDKRATDRPTNVTPPLPFSSGYFSQLEAGGCWLLVPHRSDWGKVSMWVQRGKSHKLDFALTLSDTWNHFSCTGCSMFHGANHFIYS